MAGQGIDALYGGITDGGIGVNHGAVTQYFAEPGAAPEERVETAWRCLRAGLRERAEQLLDEVVAQGHESPRLEYLRVLAAVSRRSPEELTDTDWTRLREALARPPAPGTDPEGFRTALRTVRELLTAAVSPPGGTGGDSTGTTREPVGQTTGAEIAALMSGLPDERRAEVEDHLRRVMQGIERDVSDAGEEAAVRDRRFAHDRTRRVPLFFTADPLPPRPPDPGGDSGWLPNAASGWGLAAFAFVGGLVLALTRLGEHGAGSPNPTAPGTGWPADSGTARGPGFGAPGTADAAASSDLTGLIVFSALLALGTVTAIVAAARPMMRKKARAERMRKWRSGPGAPDGGPRTARGFPRALLGTAARARPPADERPTAEARRRDRFRQTVAELVKARFAEHTPDDRSDRAADWMRDCAEQRRDWSPNSPTSSGGPARLPDWTG